MLRDLDRIAIDCTLNSRLWGKALVGLLALAADGHTARLAIELKQLTELDQLPSPIWRLRCLIAGAAIGAALEDRLCLILTDLSLPTVKRLALEMCAQTDREGWPGIRLLETLFEHEIDERARGPSQLVGDNDQVRTR